MANLIWISNKKLHTLRVWNLCNNSSRDKMSSSQKRQKVIAKSFDFVKASKFMMKLWKLSSSFIAVDYGMVLS